VNHTLANILILARYLRDLLFTSNAVKFSQEGGVVRMEVKMFTNTCKIEAYSVKRHFQEIQESSPEEDQLSHFTFVESCSKKNASCTELGKHPTSADDHSSPSPLPQELEPSKDQVSLSSPSKLIIAMPCAKLEDSSIPSDELLFLISDQGIGIPEEKWPMIFKSFSQGDSSISGKYGGTGLGLVISKKLVQAMKGDIWFQSKPGEGTTFYFTIKVPVYKQPCQERGTEDKKEQEVIDKGEARERKRKFPEECDISGLRVLIAEDNEVNQKIVGKMFQKLGVPFDLVFDGQQVIDAIKNKDYDCIFMDVIMPHMDGLEATRLRTLFNFRIH